MRSALTRLALGTLLILTACPGGGDSTDSGTTTKDGGSGAVKDGGTTGTTDAGGMVGNDAGTTSGADAGTMPGTDAGTMPGADAGTMPGNDAGTTSGNDAGTMPGNDAGSMPGNDAGSTSGNDAGTMPGTDAGTTAGDAGFIIGTRVSHFVTPTGIIDVPFDPTVEPLVAYAVSGTTFTSLPVTYLGDGGFRFSRPAGAYYLGVESGFPYYVYTDAPSIDLGYSVQGRPNTVAPDPNLSDPTLTLNATGLASFDFNTDGFGLASDSVYETGLVFLDDPQPAQGATSLVNQSASYFSELGQATLEAAKGDTATMTQSRSVYSAQDDGGVTEEYASIISAGATPAISLAPGQNTTITAVLSPLTQKAFAVDWRRSAWQARATAAHPQARMISAYLEVVAVPGGTLNRGWVGYLAELLTANGMHHRADGVYSMHYGNPKSTWAEMASISVYYAVPIQLQGGSAGTVSGIAGLSDAPATFSASPVTPLIMPPAELKVDGLGAQAGAITAASTTPLLSWTPTASGAVTYRVRVREVYVDGSTSATRSTGVGALVMNLAVGSQVRVPTGMLQSGKHYVFLVSQEANSVPFDSRTAPFYDWSSGRSAEAISSIVTMP